MTRRSIFALVLAPLLPKNRFVTLSGNLRITNPGWTPAFPTFVAFHSQRTGGIEWMPFVEWRSLMDAAVIPKGPMSDDSVRAALSMLPDMIYDPVVTKA